MPTDHEFITSSEKTQCQAHLISEPVKGDLPQCFRTKESRVKKHVSSVHQAFEGKTKLDSDFLISVMLRDWLLKNEEIFATLQTVNFKGELMEHGSRTEQAKLHEDLAEREKALRETQVVHDVEESMRSQEMRIDEFSRTN